MVSYQYCGRIYYRTFKHIYPGSELLVWYGEDYAKELGISTDFSGMVIWSYICTQYHKLTRHFYAVQCTQY